MVSIGALWLPTLVSAVIVFIAANILWMALPFWHRRDYGKLANEGAALTALSSEKSGMYMLPCLDWGKMTAEARAEMHKGPMGMLLLRNPAGEFPFAMALTSYFLYSLVISFFVAYLTGAVLPAGTPYLQVFRVAGTAGVLGYAFGGVPYSIWYGKPWSATIKDFIDGVIYGLLIGGTFGWLWPR